MDESNAHGESFAHIDDSLRQVFEQLKSRLTSLLGESLVHLVLSEQSFHDLLNRERRISLDIYQEGIPL